MLAVIQALTTPGQQLTLDASPAAELGKTAGRKGAKVAADKTAQAAAAAAAAAAPYGPAQQVATATQLLAAMPSVNIELWSKLGRAAVSQSLWGAALRCAKGALAAVPEGYTPDQAPGLAAAEWFWLGVAHTVAGQVRGAPVLLAWIHAPIIITSSRKGDSMHANTCLSHTTVVHCMPVMLTESCWLAGHRCHGSARQPRAVCAAAHEP